MTEKFTVESFRAAVAHLKAHNVQPNDNGCSIIAATVNDAPKYAEMFGVTWEPDCNGEQRIGDYLVVAR